MAVVVAYKKADGTPVYKAAETTPTVVKTVYTGQGDTRQKTYSTGEVVQISGNAASGNVSQQVVYDPNVEAQKQASALATKLTAANAPAARDIRTYSQSLSNAGYQATTKAYDEYAARNEEYRQQMQARQTEVFETENNKRTVQPTAQSQYAQMAMFNPYNPSKPLPQQTQSVAPAAPAFSLYTSTPRSKNISETVDYMNTPNTDALSSFRIQSTLTPYEYPKEQTTFNIKPADVALTFAAPVNAFTNVAASNYDFFMGKSRKFAQTKEIEYGRNIATRPYAAPFKAFDIATSPISTRSKIGQLGKSAAIGFGAGAALTGIGIASGGSFLPVAATLGTTAYTASKLPEFQANLEYQKRNQPREYQYSIAKFGAETGASLGGGYAGAKGVAVLEQSALAKNVKFDIQKGSTVRYNYAETPQKSFEESQFDILAKSKGLFKDYKFGVTAKGFANIKDTSKLSISSGEYVYKSAEYPQNPKTVNAKILGFSANDRGAMFYNIGGEKGVVGTIFKPMGRQAGFEDFTKSFSKDVSVSTDLTPKKYAASFSFKAAEITTPEYSKSVYVSQSFGVGSAKIFKSFTEIAPKDLLKPYSYSGGMKTTSTIGGSRLFDITPISDVAIKSFVPKTNLYFAPIMSGTTSTKLTSATQPIFKFESKPTQQLYIITRPKNAVESINAQKPIFQPLKDTGFKPMQDIGVTQSQRPITSSRSTQSFQPIQDFAPIETMRPNPTPAAPVIPAFPIMPRYSFDMGFPMGASGSRNTFKATKFKQPKAYKPSLYGVFGNIKAPKSFKKKGRLFTGLEVRGV